MNKNLIQLLTLTALMCGASAHAMENSEQLGRQLLDAAQEGNLELMQQLLQQGAPVDAKDRWSGDTPLMIAAQYGRTDICQLLLDNKASVDAKNIIGKTPLIHAANFGCRDACELLLNHGASVYAAGPCGWTPLWHAANNSHTDICHLLIDTLVTQIKNNKANAVVLLGLKKCYQISYIDPIDKNVIKLIAREVHTSALRQQESLFELIHTIHKDAGQQELLAYAQEKLNAKSNNNQGKL